jgi:hypothetical protein
MSKYISPPDNVEIENDDHVLRVAIEHLHYYEGIINHELFLLRKGKGSRPDENAISVVVEKLIDDQDNITKSALELVPISSTAVNRRVFRLRAGDIRNILVGVTHTPTKKMKEHGSLHGYFDIAKATKLAMIIQKKVMV